VLDSHAGSYAFSQTSENLLHDDENKPINVGTSDDDDPLLVKSVFDFHHPFVETLKAASPAQLDLIGRGASLRRACLATATRLRPMA
jgi:hypothetical protein